MVTIDDLVKKVDDHIAMSDAVHDDLAAHDRRVSERQEFIINELFGEPKPDIDGDVFRRGGRLEAIESQLKTLYEAQQNGGMNIHIPWGKLVTVLVAVIGAASAIIVAVIENQPPSP